MMGGRVWKCVVCSSSSFFIQLHFCVVRKNGMIESSPYRVGVYKKRCFQCSMNTKHNNKINEIPIK